MAIFEGQGLHWEQNLPSHPYHSFVLWIFHQEYFQGEQGCLSVFIVVFVEFFDRNMSLHADPH